MVLSTWYLVLVLLSILGVLDAGQVVDLSWEITPDIPRYSTVRQFSLNTVYNGTRDPGQYWYQNDEMESGTHVATHLDAPAHFHKGGWSVQQIPFERLVSLPTHVIDLRDKVFPKSGKADLDYLITLEDIKENYEKSHGSIQEGSVVLLFTGWSRFWNKGNLAYKGTETSVPSNYRFPGLSGDGADFLAKDRRVYGVGIDTLSIDRGSALFPAAHVALASRNVYILENVGDMSDLPPKDAKLHIGALKLGKDASGTPVRLLAELPSAGYNISVQPFVIFITVMSVLYYCQ